MIECIHMLVIAAAACGVTVYSTTTELGVTTEMTELRNQHEQAIAAAKITLLALAVQHSGKDPIRRYRIELSGQTSDLFEEEQAVVKLAEAVKPLACWSRIEGTTLEVSCQPVADDKHRQELHSHILNRLEEKQGLVGGIVGGIAPSLHDSALVELRGDSQALLVTVSALESWIRDYVIVGEFGMTTDGVVPRKTATTVRATIRFGAVKQVPVEEVYRVIRALKDTTSQDMPPS